MEQQIFELVEKLAASIGTSTEHILEVYTQQALVNGWVGIIAGIVFFLLSVICFVSFILGIIYDWDEAFCAVLVGAGTVFLIFSIPFTVAHIENIYVPEAVAISKIISQLR